MLTFFTLSAMIFGVIFMGNLLAENIMNQNNKYNDDDAALGGIFFHW